MEFDDIWTIKTAQYNNDYVPIEVEDAVKKIVKEHPFLSSNHELSFKGEYDEEYGIDWSDIEDGDGEFWISPKPGFSFNDSSAAAPHVSHSYGIEDMMNDILTLKPCGTDCDGSDCKKVDTSGHTEQSLQKITESLLIKHNLIPLLKKHGLDNYTRRSTPRLKAWRKFLDKVWDEE